MQTACFVAAVILPSVAFSENIVGRASVIDADTIEILGQRVRIQLAVWPAGRAGVG